MIEKLFVGKILPKDGDSGGITESDETVFAYDDDGDILIVPPHDNYVVPGTTNDTESDETVLPPIDSDDEVVLTNPPGWHDDYTSNQNDDTTIVNPGTGTETAHTDTGDTTTVTDVHDPTKYTVSVDSKLKGALLFIKATWVAAYAYPEVNKGLRAISYSSKMIAHWKLKYKSSITDERIGTLTGNYTIINNVTWLEITPEYCNRLKTAWVRANDVVQKTSTTKSTTKKTSWLTWLLTGLAAYSLIS